MDWRSATLLTACLLTGTSAGWAQESLAGFYHITPGGIGAGYSAHFALEDLATHGVWSYGDQYECSEDGAPNDEWVAQRTGIWRVEGDTLVLTERSRITHRGGTCRCHAILCFLADSVTDFEHPGREIVVDLEAPCASEYDPMEMVGVELPCLTIEGTGYFRLGPVDEMRQ